MQKLIRVVYSEKFRQKEKGGRPAVISIHFTTSLNFKNNLKIGNKIPGYLY